MLQTAPPHTAVSQQQRDDARRLLEAAERNALATLNTIRRMLGKRPVKLKDVDN